MKKIILLSLTLVLTALISITLFSYFTGKQTYPKSVIQTKIHSKVLEEEREIIIHLPRDYDKSKEYSVVYVLDGSSLDIPIAKSYDILTTAGFVQEAIIVGLPNVNGKGRQRDYTPSYMKMDLDTKNNSLGEGDKFLTFIEKELIPYISHNYSVSGIRSLAGNSRGGLLVMYSLLYKPNLFQGRFCFSPSFWRVDNLIVKKVGGYLQSKVDSSPSFLYMSMGDEENTKMKNGFNEMAKVLKEYPNKKLLWHSEYTKNANHQNNAELSIPAAIRKWTNYLKAN